MTIHVEEISVLGVELAALVPTLEPNIRQRHPVHRTKLTDVRAPIAADDRKYVYERDGFKCVWCQSTVRLTLDHILPWSAFGSDDVDNLRTLCWDCNEHRSNFKHIDDTWRPLPVTFCCVDCDAQSIADWGADAGTPLEHPSMCPCFCWWCRHPAIGSRSSWFSENHASWDYDLNWHRESSAPRSIHLPDARGDH